MRKLIKIFKALSDPNRIRILKMLQIRSLCVCEIREVLALANSTVSKHLTLLRDAELIWDYKDGKWVNYSLNPSTTEKYVSQLLPLLANWLPDDSIILSDTKKVKEVDRDIICRITG
jgi:ArsR family transcriptional regulator